MEGRPLDHLELLSIALKDEHYYHTWIGDNLQELTQRYFGIRKWLQFRNAITVLSRFGYFAMTTLSQIPTPGEEFCEAQAPHNSGLVKSLLMIALNNELQLPPEITRSYPKFIRDVHLITYYIFGDFYELAKRATNFAYTTTSCQSKQSNYLYGVLGCMSIFQLAINIPNQCDLLEPVVKRDNSKTLATISSRPTTDSRIACHLCSENRVEPSSTVCGHIFCWNCIHLWLKERSECPICRTPTEPSRLIHLINFR